jgi:hypothetical protein
VNQTEAEMHPHHHFHSEIARDITSRRIAAAATPVQRRRPSALATTFRRWFPARDGLVDAPRRQGA